MTKLIRTAATKLAAAEHDALHTAAEKEGISVSEWMRRLVLVALQRTPNVQSDQLLLAEIFALRAIAINLLFTIGSGTQLTQEAVTSTIVQADRDKTNRAIAHLKSSKEPYCNETALD